MAFDARDAPPPPLPKLVAAPDKPQTAGARLRTYFLTGIIVAGPLAVSVITPTSPFVPGPAGPVLSVVVQLLCGSAQDTVRHDGRRLLPALLSPSA